MLGTRTTAALARHPRAREAPPPAQAPPLCAAAWRDAAPGSSGTKLEEANQRTGPLRLTSDPARAKEKRSPEASG